MSKESKFLIRSSGYILGPYTKKEVEEFIENGNFSSFDDVIEPCSYALYLQDHPEFSEFIKNLSHNTRITNYIMKSIGSKVSTLTGKTVKETTSTKTIKEGTVTQPLNEDTVKTTDAHFELVQDQSISQGRHKKASYKSSKESARINRQRVSFIMKKLWQMIIAFAIFLAGYIGFKEVYIPHQNQKKQIQKIQTQGLNFYKSGDYAKAFVLFKDGADQNLLTLKDKIIFLNLLIQQGETDQADLLLREVENSLPKGSHFLIQGLIKMIEKSYPLAEELFTQALSHGEEQALVNLSILKWTTGRPTESLEDIQKLISQGYTRALISYLNTLNLMDAEDSSKNLKEYILQQIKRSPEYRQEFKLLLAYLHIQDGDVSVVEDWIHQALDWDPYFIQEYYYDSLINISIVNDWSVLFDYCQSIFEMNPENIYFNALYGFCYLKVGNHQQGFQYIKKARNLDPENPLILSMYAYGLMLEGNLDEADVLLGSILESPYQIPFILRARLFENQKQWNLSLRYWKQVLEKDLYSISAMGGIAFGNYQIGNLETTDVYKERALSRYPYYIKLLSLPSSQ